MSTSTTAKLKKTLRVTIGQNDSIIELREFLGTYTETAAMITAITQYQELFEEHVLLKQEALWLKERCQAFKDTITNLYAAMDLLREVAAMNSPD